MILWNLIGFIVTILILATAIFGGLKFKYLKEKGKFLVIFLFFSCIMQAISTTMVVYFKMKNLWLLPFYTFGEYVLFHLYLHENTKFKKPAHKLASMIFLFFMSILILKDFFFINSINHLRYNSLTIGIKAFVLVAWTLFVFIQEIKLVNSNQDVKERDAFSILNFGILFYFSVQFIVYTLSNYMLDVLTSAQNQMIWTFNALSNIIFYTILFFGLWKLTLVRRD